MHFYLQKYALLPAKICTSTYVLPLSLFCILSACLCISGPGGGNSGCVVVDFPVTLSQSLRGEGGAWWHAGGSEITVDFFDSTNILQCTRQPFCTFKSKTYSCALCIKNCITSNHCLAFCPSFLLVLKNVAEMHNLSSTVHRDAIRKYIYRIAVYCVSCVIAMARYSANVFLQISCFSVYCTFLAQ
jgi:hypothetical protein